MQTFLASFIKLDPLFLSVWIFSANLRPREPRSSNLDFLGRGLFQTHTVFWQKADRWQE